MKYLPLLILMAFLFPALSFGANTYTAVNCNRSGTNSLGALIAAASDGDTVNGPSGGGSATWSSAVTSTATIALINGNGCAITASNNDVFQLTWTNSSVVPRVTNFTINGAFGQAAFNLNGNVPAFRIDHITVNQAYAGSNPYFAMIGYQSWTVYSRAMYGLFDHITWTCTANSVCNAFLFYGVNQSWNAASTMGTAQAIYVEDSTFTCPSCGGMVGGTVTDSQQGAQWVLRHSTIHNEGIQEHDIGAVEARSTRQKEVYNNTVTCGGSTTGACFDAIGMRGGTGMDFNNQIALDVNGNTGWSTALFTQIFRVNPGGGQIPWLFAVANPNIICAPSGSGCGGSPTGGICSDFVAHDTTSSHSICYASSSSCIANPTPSQAAAGQCGKAYYNSSITNTLLTQFDGTGTGGYPARDQTGAGPDTGANHVQTGGADPEYIWNITDPNNGGAVNYSAVTDNNAPYIEANRDYYQQVGSFDGAAGVGVGLLSGRPTTCTAGAGGNPGAGYWATDTNTLYTCGPVNNIWSVHYKPYTYPHPLQAGAVGGPPTSTEPPTNLTVTVK